ncbi:class I SAM-dependent methyltransferase [Bacillus sp. AGMB 02131]|uniref:Class I SAM-dependent methyltransferase n=1 Tax=Peribacillus faecalis TaxID=2772559 RepID=A0A927HD98_9BACI|nr:class I SAM-dependent methyltransferase [Peribacillus faecalis]MBD3110467.1 class I SAM-dependent methyltransferase [Peribacillus faecalis]
MKFESIEQAFELFEQTANVIEQECNCTYLEALAETADNIFHHSILQEELSEMSKKRLLKQYDQADFSQLDEETTRKAFQLAILKGMKDNIQPNHQMTPDTIGIFVSYLVRKFMGDNKRFRLFDPAIGTGNLVFTIMQQLKECDIHAIGIDVDDVLIKLAYSGANLLQQPLELYTGDSMKPLFIDPVDVVVSDLPVGYYPDDERASEFEVSASDSEEHTYAHHLLIEQSIKHLAEGGYGIYIVPNSLFESAQSVLLNQYLKKATYIQGLVALPLNLFKNESAAKSVLIVQKKKEGIQQPKQALLAQLPHFSNAKAMSQMLQQMDEWFKAEKNN